MDSLETLITQTILPFSRKYKYTLVSLSYWADAEDYYYAPIIVGSNELLSIVRHGIRQCNSQSQRKFAESLRKAPMIVGTVILRCASGDELNEAACKELLRCLGEYCLTPEATHPASVHKGQNPPKRATTVCEGFDEAERQILSENLGAMTVQDHGRPSKVRPVNAEGNQHTQAVVVSAAVAASHSAETISCCLDFVNSLPPLGPGDPWCDMCHLHDKSGDTIVAAVPNRSRHNTLPLQLLTVKEAAILKAELEEAKREEDAKLAKRDLN